MKKSVLDTMKDVLGIASRERKVSVPEKKPVEIMLYRGVREAADPRCTKQTIAGALFYSPSETVARDYAGKKGNVAADRIQFQNLLSAPTWVDAKHALGLNSSHSMEDLINVARERGHDGLTFRTKNGQEYVVIPNVREVPAIETPRRLTVKELLASVASLAKEQARPRRDLGMER